MPVNLLPRKTFEEGAFWEKLLTWSLGVGRIVIMGTEVVVLSVFFSRFFLDRKMTDLSEDVRTKQTIIATTGDLETRYRVLQDQLTAIRELKNAQNQFSQALEALTEKVPPTTALDNLTVNEKGINITARTPSGQEFARLLIQLFTWKDLSQVALKNANFLPKEGVFSFTLDLKISTESYRLAKQ